MCSLVIRTLHCLHTLQLRTLVLKVHTHYNGRERRLSNIDQAPLSLQQYLSKPVLHLIHTILTHFLFFRLYRVSFDSRTLCEPYTRFNIIKRQTEHIFE